jgi:hypothetical protein
MARKWTDPQITALANALALGVTLVEYDGKRTQYRSLAEMRSLLREMETDRDIHADKPLRPLSRPTVFVRG